MTLTIEEKLYQQQKNREHCYAQADREVREQINSSRGALVNRDKMQFLIDKRYEELCRNSNLYPWVF